MVDARIWWELKKQGHKEPRRYSDKAASAVRDWAVERAKRRGWIEGR